MYKLHLQKYLTVHLRMSLQFTINKNSGALVPLGGQVSFVPHRGQVSSVPQGGQVSLMLLGGYSSFSAPKGYSGFRARICLCLSFKLVRGD